MARRSRPVRRTVVGTALALLLCAAGLGYVAADIADVVPGPLTDEPAPVVPTYPPAVGAGPLPPAAPPVLARLDGSASRPAPAALADVLDPLLRDPALGRRVVAAVADGITGQPLYSRSRATALEPASVAKLVTGTAALARLGPQHRLRTRVVAGHVPGAVVLVGGGDVLLTSGASTGPTDPGGERAGLADLADEVAASLASRPGAAGPVTVRLDDTLFAPEGLAPGVIAFDVAAGFTAPLGPVAVDAGRTRPGRYAPRVSDPALAAAQRFADLLAQRRVDVVGEVSRGSAPPGTAVLGEVASAPLAEVVQYTLRTSDNVVADSLAHLVARAAGRPATFAGSGRAVLDVVTSLGVDTTGARLVDGSGLGDGSVLPPRLITDTLVVAGSPAHPGLRPLLPGLPVAGLEGTLVDRFDSGPASAAAGIVRAKTGTLTGTAGLAGTVVDADGAYLVFAVLADDVAGPQVARDALDDVATALARCGCGSRG